MRRQVKRLVDIVMAGGGLLVLAPVMIVVGGLVRLTMGQPVLFRQRRPGYRARPFELLKFRTMVDARGPDGRQLDDAARTTRLGRTLRQTSLDELPELWNILRGDMSVVGPRPLLMRYLDVYTPAEARRHDVKPGLTGMAQVNGRRQISMEERLALDLWYVDHWSLRLDAEIIARTLRMVVTGSGVEPVAEVEALDLRWEEPPLQPAPPDGGVERDATVQG